MKELVSRLYEEAERCEKLAFAFGMEDDKASVELLVEAAAQITKLEARQQSDAAMIDLLKQQHAIDREQLADSNEALQVMGLKLEQAEALPSWTFNVFEGAPPKWSASWTEFLTNSHQSKNYSGLILRSRFQDQSHSANTVGEREARPACGDDVEHVWCLISPEGKRFTGDTKMAAYRAETSSRVPSTEQLENIMRANAECEAEYQADLEQARKQGYQSGYAAGLEVNSANTVGGPTPVMDAAPAREQTAWADQLITKDTAHQIAFAVKYEAEERAPHVLGTFDGVRLQGVMDACDEIMELIEGARVANHQATFQSGHECVSRVSNSDSRMNKQDATRTAGESDS